MTLQNFLEKLKNTILDIKSLNNKTDSLIGLYYTKTLEGKDIVGYHFVQPDVKAGDTGHFDHGVGINKNKDLIYLITFKTVPEEFDIDSLGDLALDHSAILRVSKQTIENSSKLMKLGFDLNVSYLNGNRIVNLITKDTKENILTLQNSEADDFIDTFIIIVVVIIIW